MDYAVDCFVSQNDQNYFPKVTCGVASLMMLLKYHKLDDECSYEALADELRLTVPPEEKGYSKQDPALGVYPEDVYKLLHKKGVLFRVSFYEDEWSRCLADSPIMVLMRNGDQLFTYDGHWIVLIKFDDDTFTYADPWYTRESNHYIRTIHRKHFYAAYTGVACQIVVKKGEHPVE